MSRRGGTVPAVVFGLLSVTGLAGAVARWEQGWPGSQIGTQLDLGLGVANGALAALFYGLVAWLFLVRWRRRGPAASGPARAVALAGTFAMAAVAAQPRTQDDWRILLVSDLLLATGLLSATCAAWSLGRCFGLAPEARGLVTNGAYRLVRHPMYLGELVAALGVVLPTLAPTTVVIWAAFAVCQIARARTEERVLGGAFAAYGPYRHRTPFLVPRPVWRGGRSQGNTNTVHWPPEMA